MAYMPTLPSKSPFLKNLTYVIEENSFFNESSGGSIFGGHPSLNQRNDSFDIKESMTVHCGYDHSFPFPSLFSLVMLL